MNLTFSPLELYQHALRRWWVIVLAALAGGLAGGLAYSLLPQVYEARAGITFNFDYNITGVLSETQEDEALGVAGELVYSTYVINQVSSDAALEGIHISPAELRSASSQERRAYIWYLHVRHANPAVAARLANLWVDRGLSELDDASAHSTIYRSLQRFMDTLESCLQDVAAEPPAYALCRTDNLAYLLGEIRGAGEKVQREKLAARGILPGLMFALTEKAEVPAAPVVRSRNVWILAGALAGLCLGGLVVLVLWNKPRRRDD